MLIGSLGLRYITETEISDGKGGKKKISVGDKVDLMPFEQTEKGKKPQKSYIAELGYDMQKRDLGQGPYTVTNIGHWPCGRIMLYLKTTTSSGTGVYPDDFKAI